MLKSLRYRLLLWFVLSSILISAFLFLLFQFHKSAKHNQQQAIESVNYFRYQFLKDQSNVANFLANETTNTNFFITGESDFLIDHYRHSAIIDSCYLNCSNMPASAYSDNLNPVADIRNSYTNYCMVLDSLVYKIYQRGYKNYGLEGELASYMFRLEKMKEFSLNKINSLKLAENEYVNQYDTNYIHKVNQLCNSLITNTLLNNRYTPNEKTYLVELIKSYKNTFNKIVKIDNEIGVGSQKGLKQQLSEIGFQLEDLVNSSIVEAHTIYKANMARVNILFALSSFLLIALAFALSVYTSRYLVKHLEQLHQYINLLAKNNLNHQLDFDLRHSTSEIRQIYLEFRNLLANLRIRERQRDKALRIAEDNQQRYQELADLLPQCVYETDRNGNLTYVNNAWYKAFGYSTHDIDKGINLTEIINASANSSLFGYTKVENNEYMATRIDGTEFPATIYSDIIKKGVRIVGRRGIIIDSTLRNRYIESLKKETARAKTSDKHKSSFLANMSHEIRTPMNSIIGFTNMLASREIPEDMKDDFIGHIQTSSEMLLNLIDDIIDIAKIEDGQLKIKKIECRPVELISSLASNFEAYKNKVEKKHIDIRISVPQDNIVVRTDAFRLKQIISNLMSNSIKFTEEGWIEVGMKVKNQRKLEFYVQDTGIGMTKDDLRTVFERFNRTKLSEEKKISGTGLGLAISKNLVEILGGTMWVESESGKGTRFSFELPYIQVANPEIEKPENTQEIEVNWQNKKFLIAEDDDASFTYLSHILEVTGVKLVHAHNGKEAMEALSFHKDIELVLMDLRMPVMDGLTATKQIKARFPKLPVIAQTAFAMDGDRSKCLAAGCDDYITKPIDGHSLLAKINQFVVPNQHTNNPSRDIQVEQENNLSIVDISKKSPPLN